MNSPIITVTSGQARGLLTHLINAVRVWACERKARQMMSQLPDRLLKDAGVIRDDLTYLTEDKRGPSRSGNW
ncbi:hypothetical protein [Nioella aestuarii]|uniref:hypothetical protein n=1 Tax=Nioella aestuarii TaxID=1662864 RepID=UPI003D7F8C6E